MLVIFIQGQLIHMLASVIILLVIGSILSLRLRHAIALNAMMFTVIFLIPYIFIGRTPAAHEMGLYGLLSGLVAAAISGVISVRMYKTREFQIAAYREIEEKNQELASLADANRRQFEGTTALLAEMTGVVRSLGDAVRRIQQEASQLSSSAEEMSASVSEMVHTNEEVYESIGSIDSMLQANRKSVADFGRWEREEATVQRERLAEVTAGMAGTVSEIGKITSMVTDITRKTHILALNAGIEAAKTGTSGGFGVIAGRMRELAEEVRQKTMDIVGLVRALENTSDLLSHLMGDYTSRSSAAGEGFGKTVDGIDVMANGMALIRHKAEAMASASEQQAAAINTLAASAARLNTLVDDLQSLMARVSETEEKIRKSV